MNGNITKEGIKLDLEWMKRIGLGGFQNFDAALATPQIVGKRLVYMTPEWKDAFRYAATLADQLGMEMAIAGSPGWSETGGPWVPPSQGMKKLVWSSTVLKGGRPFNGKLPDPPSTTGPFQDIPRPEGFDISGAPPPPPVKYYADSAVIAYRIPDGEVSMIDLKPKITSSGGQFHLAALTDGDLQKPAPCPLLLMEKHGSNSNSQSLSRPKPSLWQREKPQARLKCFWASSKAGENSKPVMTVGSFDPWLYFRGRESESTQSLSRRSPQDSSG
jgi:hypothetical protein